MQNKDIINENIITNNNNIALFPLRGRGLGRGDNIVCDEIFRSAQDDKLKCHSEALAEESQNRLQHFAQDDGTKTSYSPITLIPYYPKKKIAFTKPSRTTSDSESRVCVNVDVESSLQTRAVVFNARRSFKKVAFTLAEVLITLGVIGVVAALTLPTLIQNYKKSVIETSLKKAYSEIYQVLKKSQDEHGDSDGWDFTLISSGEKKEIVHEYFGKYVANCQELSMAGSEHRYGAGAKLSDYPRKLYKCPAYRLETTALGDNAGFGGDYKNPTLLFQIFINKVNKQSKYGENVFFFIYTSNQLHAGTKSVAPSKYHYEMSENELLNTARGNCSAPTNLDTGGFTYTGEACATVIQRNSWKIPDNYPIKF